MRCDKWWYEKTSIHKESYRINNNGELRVKSKQFTSTLRKYIQFHTQIYELHYIGGRAQHKTTQHFRETLIVSTLHAYIHTRNLETIYIQTCNLHIHYPTITIRHRWHIENGK